MEWDAYCLGDLSTNAFVLKDDSSRRCWVFDCPPDSMGLIQGILGQGREPEAVFLTHAHVDHIAGLDEFRKSFPLVRVYQHPIESSWLQDPQANLSAWMGNPVAVARADEFVNEGQSLMVGAVQVRVLHLPGHSPGSVGYWFPELEALVGGDVLFRGGVGRWDFPGSDRDSLKHSLDRVQELPDSTRIYPGHGGSTTVGREKASNPYLRSEEAWW